VSDIQWEVEAYALLLASLLLLGGSLGDLYGRRKSRLQGGKSDIDDRPIAMNAMLEARIVAAKTHGPFPVATGFLTANPPEASHGDLIGIVISRKPCLPCEN
jgi:hypothetical protein